MDFKSAFEGSLYFRYQQAKSQFKEIVCDECGFDFGLDNTEIKTTVMDSKKENIYFVVTWFRCPGCGKVYIILVETKRTLQIKNEYFKYVEKLKSKKYMSNKMVHRKLEKIEIKLKKYLSENKRVFGETLSQIISEQF